MLQPGAGRSGRRCLSLSIHGCCRRELGSSDLGRGAVSFPGLTMPRCAWAIQRIIWIACKGGKGEIRRQVLVFQKEEKTVNEFTKEGTNARISNYRCHCDGAAATEADSSFLLTIIRIPPVERRDCWRVLKSPLKRGQEALDTKDFSWQRLYVAIILLLQHVVSLTRRSFFYFSVFSCALGGL
jgi:hypothetical protein